MNIQVSDNRKTLNVNAVLHPSSWRRHLLGTLVRSPAPQRCRRLWRRSSSTSNSCWPSETWRDARWQRRPATQGRCSRSWRCWGKDGIRSVTRTRGSFVSPLLPSTKPHQSLTIVNWDLLCATTRNKHQKSCISYNVVANVFMCTVTFSRILV